MFASTSPSRRRRRLLLGMLLASPLSVDAQSAKKVYRIGYLPPAESTSSLRPPPEAFRRVARARLGGGTEHRDRAALCGRPGRPASRARGGTGPAQGGCHRRSPVPATLAARTATQTIPIVGMGLSEPVAAGLVASSDAAPARQRHRRHLQPRHRNLRQAASKLPQAKSLPKARLVGRLVEPGRFAGPAARAQQARSKAVRALPICGFSCWRRGRPQEFDAVRGDGESARGRVAPHGTRSSSSTGFAWPSSPRGAACRRCPLRHSGWKAEDSSRTARACRTSGAAALSRSTGS